MAMAKRGSQLRVAKRAARRASKNGLNWGLDLHIPISWPRNRRQTSLPPRFPLRAKGFSEAGQAGRKCSSAARGHLPIPPKTDYLPSTPAALLRLSVKDCRVADVIGIDGKNRIVPSPVRGRLPTAARTRIIELFAQFQPVKEIRAVIRAEFGRDLADATISHYDPTRASSKLSQEQRAQFAALRAAYVDSASSVAIAHQAHRLRNYEAVYAKALKSNDFASALKAMELAAKEMGGVLTNTSTVKHEGKVDHRHLTLEDAKAELAMRLASVMEKETITLSLPASSVTHEVDSTARDVAQG